jgi:mannose-6-phosphate isomerase-like protein (cupin superfamily)
LFHKVLVLLLVRASKTRKDVFMNAVVLKAGEGRTLPLGPIHMVVQEDGTHTRGTLGVAEFEVAPHAPTPPPHIHHAHEEGFYILEGELEFLAGTQTLRASQGTFVMVPIGTVHTFSNPTDKPARFLNTFTPPLYLGYFEELSRLNQASVAPPPPQQLAELMARYDTEVVS